MPYTAFVGFSRLTFTACVAPKFLAASSFSSERSRAIILSAPAIEAPCTLLIPTPPVPMTTTLHPD